MTDAFRASNRSIAAEVVAHLRRATRSVSALCSAASTRSVRTAHRDARRRFRLRGPLIAVTLACASQSAAATKGDDAPEIITSDAVNFYRVYDAAVGRPTADALQKGYFDIGSPSFRAFAVERKITAQNLVDAVQKDPSKYSGARRCMAALPEVRARLLVAFRRLKDLYPPSRFPPVTLVIGRGSTGGTTNSSGVVIGLETLCAADYMDPDIASRFVHLIAHEYVHVQQPAAQADPVKPTVLFTSLVEGGAEFVGERISGDIGNYQLKRWTKGHEAEIEQAFARDLGSTDLTPWLRHGPGTPDHPGDLGYWVGYRIVRSYYEHAADKRQAIRDIIEMQNPEAFLAASGWHPATDPAR